MMRLQRVPNWRTLLHQWGREQVGRPFVWGQTDCASLGRAALAIMFGRDILPLPSWDTLASAVRVREASGPMGEVLQGLGADVVTLGFLRSGDLVVCPEAEERVGQEALLVCLDGRKCLRGTHEAGVLLDVVTDGTAYSLWEVNSHG